MGAPHKFNIFHYLMFEISDLKAKKLPELQEIAKELNVPKFKSLKKLDLVYQILDVQASNPKAVAETVAATTDEKPSPKPTEAKSAEEGTTEKAPPRKAPQKREPRSQKDDSKAANTSPQQQQQQKKDTKPQGNTPQKSQNNKRNNQ